MNRCLFIGGKLDGQWIEVANDHQYISVPIRDGNEFGRIDYKRETLIDKNGDCVHVFFYDEGETSLMRILINGYSSS